MCCSEEPCVLNYNASDYAVRIGDHDLNTIGDTPIEKTIMVQKLIHHPFFSNYSCNGPYDLTILELSETVDLNIYTPACLAQTGEYLRFEGNFSKNQTLRRVFLYFAYFSPDTSGVDEFRLVSLRYLS